MPRGSSPTVREGACSQRYALAYAWATAPFRLSRPRQRRNYLCQHVRLRCLSLQHRIFFAFAVSQLMILPVTFVVDRKINAAMTRISRLFDRFAQNVR